MNSMYDCKENMQCQVINYHKETLIKIKKISVFSMIFDTNWIITTIKVLFVPQIYAIYDYGKHFIYLIIILFGMITCLLL